MQTKKQKEWYEQNKERVNQHRRELYQKNKTERLQKMKEYHARPEVKAHRAQLEKEKRKSPEYKAYHADIMKKWRKRNPERTKQISVNHYWRNHEKRQQTAKIGRDKLKQDLYKILGDRCISCGNMDKRVLQFDHIQGNGNKEVKKFKSNSTMLRYYRDNPKECKNRLQVLCANCNWIKKHTNDETVKKYSY